MTDQIFIKKPYARSYQTDKTNCIDQAVRFYRDSPTTLTMQIRTNTDKRGRIATVSITRQEALDIAAFLTLKASELRDH